MPTGLRFPSLAAWLDWQQSLHPQAIDLGLSRVARVLGRTGWRGPEQPVVTVAGTNGKGSCVAMLDAILRAAGHRVAAFTSPHLIDYRERIRLDGRWVSEASLVAVFERIADALGDDTLTFFEFNTVAALLVFESWRPDAILLEVGMGGRLDSVNVVDADVAIVTSISLDHVEWLGPDVESIGREKAGIFRAGRPAICGMATPPRSIIDTARRVGADLRLRGRDFDATRRGAASWDFVGARTAWPALPLPALPGATQVANAATVLAALESIADCVPCDRASIETGLACASLEGRFQRWPDAAGFEWVLDVAHNPDSARVLASNLREFPAPGRTFAVCGMLSDKDVAAVVGELRDSVDGWFAATTDGPRGLDDARLVERARVAGIAMQRGGTIEEAMRLASVAASAADRIVVFGSFHTVGPALSRLRNPL
jgi:dihydrofolate synthase/folylpolyglutamate synthase